MPKELDDRLYTLLNPCYRGSENKFVSLGRPGFERVLEAIAGKVSFAPPSDDFHDHYDYVGGLHFAISAFAAEDLTGVLAELAARKWTALQIAESGVGRVPDPRVGPFLLTALADQYPGTRVGAVNHLGMQRDPRATEALLRALSDRSSEVRRAAIEALGESGDPRAIDPLKALALKLETLTAKPERSRYLAKLVGQALRKLRRRKPSKG